MSSEDLLKPLSAEYYGIERVLLVDDEEMLLEIYEDNLSALGYTVVPMADSRKALGFIEEHCSEIDIIVTDLVMPGVTGVELAKAGLKRRKDLPIIFCSGYTAAITPEEVAALGIRRFATKPLQRNELARLVRETLDECRAAHHEPALVPKAISFAQGAPRAT